MAKKYTPERVSNGEVPYLVLKEIINSENGLGASDIHKRLNRSGRSNISKILSTLYDMDFVSKRREGQAVKYTLKPEGIAKHIKDDFNTKGFEGIEKFIETYVENYLANTDQSTIGKMIKGDFAQGLWGYTNRRENEMTEEQKQFCLDVTNSYIKRQEPEDYIAIAFSNLE